MPTRVLSKYTWVRNGGLTTLLPVLSLYLGLGFVFSERVCVEALRVPVALVGVDSGVGDISGRPLFLLGFTCFYALIFAFLLCCHNDGASSVTSTLAEANLNQRSTWLP